MTTGYSGRLLTLAVSDGTSPVTYDPIAAMRDTTLTMTEQEVDITTKDDDGKRNLLSGRILQAMTVAGTGVLTNSAVYGDLYTDFLAGTHRNYEIDVVDAASNGGATFTGPFRITQLEVAGAHDGEVNYSITLASAGAITKS